MSPAPKLNSISPARRRIVERCREIRFGVIKELSLRAGEPDFSPRTKFLHDGKLSGRIEGQADTTRDFALKAQWFELFAIFDRFSDARFEFIEVQDGLPFRYRVEKLGGDGIEIDWSALNDPGSPTSVALHTLSD